MKYCTNCGKKLNEGIKFCPSCGQKIKNISSEKKEETLRNISLNTQYNIEKINKKIVLQNNQTSIVKKSWYTAGFFALVILVAIMDFDGLPIHPAIVMLSIFFFIMAIIIGFMFRSREKKLQTLISGENLVAEWTLTNNQKNEFANHLFKNEFSKNKIILFSISTIAIIIFGVFILVIDEGKLAMFLVLVGLLLFLSIVAFGMPLYYKMKNAKGDGNILIGGKFAYINGYFHNWDFPLSGFKKIKIIETPFYGINLIYYYTDRTLNHSEELFIPSPNEIDLNNLVTTLKNLNAKQK